MSSDFINIQPDWDKLTLTRIMHKNSHGGLEIWAPCTGLVITRVVSITCLSSVLGTSGLFQQFLLR